MADEPHDRVLVREDPDDVGSALDLLIQPLQRIRRMQLGSMLRGEGHVGEHVMLGLVHQPAEFLEPGPQLIGDVPPDLARRLAVGLDEGLVDSGGDNRLLRLWHEGQRIAHEVHATALPCRADDPLDGGLQPFVRVRDHELDAAQASDTLSTF